MQLRQPIISMLAHVDHGKTSILDCLRKTVVASKEAGAITQHVSASEVPIDVIRTVCGSLIAKHKVSIKIPGLLFIDLPGHEAFTSLRERCGALADLAVLVVDVMQGLQPQTVECIKIIKQHKVPFVVAVNKIDLIDGWIPQKTYSLIESLNKQNERTKNLLDGKLYQIIGELATYGFDSERFDRVSDPTKQLLLLPISAKTGEGIAEFLLYITGLSQKYLENNLRFEVKGPAKGSVLEVKDEKGLGTTLDVIIYEGTLKKGDEIIVLTFDGTKVVKVRGLMKPLLPGQVARLGKRYEYIDTVVAAAGVKLFAADVDDVIPGSPFVSLSKDTDFAKVSNELCSDIKHVLFESDVEGIIVKADTLGSIEAVLKLLKASAIPVRSTGIGKIVKRDIIEAESVKERDKYLGAIIAFGVRCTEDARTIALKLGIPVIESNVVYDLVDKYKSWVKKEKTKDKILMEAFVQWPSKVNHYQTAVSEHQNR